MIGQKELRADITALIERNKYPRFSTFFVLNEVKHKLFILQLSNICAILVTFSVFIKDKSTVSMYLQL